MNEFHQISLKLQLGIDPMEKVDPITLRELWEQRCQAQMKERMRSGQLARQIRVASAG
jgi:hypothetical protein